MLATVGPPPASVSVKVRVHGAHALPALVTSKSSTVTASPPGASAASPWRSHAMAATAPPLTTSARAKPPSRVPGGSSRLSAAAPAARAAVMEQPSAETPIDTASTLSMLVVTRTDTVPEGVPAPEIDAGASISKRRPSPHVGSTSRSVFAHAPAANGNSSVDPAYRWYQIETPSPASTTPSGVASAAASHGGLNPPRNR